MTRTGKIARLPASIRDQLNRRLLDNELIQTRSAPRLLAIDYRLSPSRVTPRRNLSPLSALSFPFDICHLPSLSPVF